MKLKISETLSLPIDAATQTFAFIARKGAGKTYAAGKLAELLLEQAVQVVILDTVGNWYGLRIAADGKGARQILIAAAQHPEGVTDEQIAVLTGYKNTSRTTYKQQLKASGYLADGGRGYQATDRGLEWLGRDYEPLPTGDALREHWMRNLPQGELALFKVYVENHPNDVPVEQIMQATGYQRTSVMTYRQKLSARNLIVGHRASDNLFD